MHAGVRARTTPLGSVPGSQSNVERQSRRARRAKRTPNGGMRKSIIPESFQAFHTAPHSGQRTHVSESCGSPANSSRHTGHNPRLSIVRLDRRPSHKGSCLLDAHHPTQIRLTTRPGATALCSECPLKRPRVTSTSINTVMTDARIVKMRRARECFHASDSRKAWTSWTMPRSSVTFSKY